MDRRPPEGRAPRLEEARGRLDAHLRREGLRATRQRDAVLEAFLACGAHVSVDELCERLRASHPSIGAATVYRCMGLFVQAGVAKERRFHEGRVRYEPGVGTSHHDHLICLACGDIQEFEDPTIERLQDEVAGSRGFDVTYHRLEIYGLCPRCRGQRVHAPEGPSRCG